MTLIDLTDVTRVDTAGVALLAHLVAVGKSREQASCFMARVTMSLPLRNSTICLRTYCLVNIFSALLPKALTDSSSGLLLV